MATGGKGGAKTVARTIGDGVIPAPAAKAANDTGGAAIDQDALPLADLARAVLARDIRPRIGSLRRLAEAVLEAETKPTANGKGKSSKPGKKKKKKKLARIPGQKK